MVIGEAPSRQCDNPGLGEGPCPAGANLSAPEATVDIRRKQKGPKYVFDVTKRERAFGESRIILME